MIRLDTLKLGISNDALQDFDVNNYTKSGQLDADDNILSKRYVLKSEREIENGLEKKLGITSIVIKENEVQLEMSSKVLRKDYASLINKNNIEQVIDNINATGLVKFDKNEFIDSAQCYKFDVTCNLPVTKASDDYLRDISILGSKRKYDFTNYKSGFALTNRAATVDERLIAYDKEKDLLKKDKWNREILKHIDIKDYHNVFRIEGNYRTYDTMRKYFHFKRHNIDIIKNKAKGIIKLSDVLLSDANPNYELYNKMLSSEVDITGNLLLDLLNDKDISLCKVEREIGRAEIIKHCNYDLVSIKRVIASKVKGNISSYLRDYETLLKKMRVKELSNYDNINEVRELLKVA